MKDDEFENFLNGFLYAFKYEKISIENDKDENNFKLIIENPVWAQYLEIELKKLKTTYEFGRNKEIYIVSKEKFLEILKQDEDLFKKFEEKKLNKNIKNIAKLTAEIFKEIIKDLVINFATSALR